MEKSLCRCQGIFGRRCAKTAISITRIASPTHSPRHPCRRRCEHLQVVVRKNPLESFLAPGGWNCWSSEMPIKWSRQPLDRNAISLSTSFQFRSLKQWLNIEQNKFSRDTIVSETNMFHMFQLQHGFVIMKEKGTQDGPPHDPMVLFC